MQRPYETVHLTLDLEDGGTTGKVDFVGLHTVASEPGGIRGIDPPVVNPGGIIPPLCRQNCVQKLRYMGANNYE